VKEIDLIFLVDASKASGADNFRTAKYFLSVSILLDLTVAKCNCDN